ncbi:major facilitator superfamily transporter [Xylaria sp. FL1777]|nr:major facilitator superfamily transporter [Xylaria sp. FL1777]
MAVEEIMFRNSVWSRDNHDITLYSFSELDTPWNNFVNRVSLPVPDPISKFSADSDDDGYDNFDDGYILFVVTICAAQLCAQAGIGQTLPIMKGVGSQFHVVNANNLSSSIAAYVVALGTFVLIAGRMGETFGNKRVFILGLAWSAAWSLIIGASFYSTQSLFIISQAFHGLGAALTLPTGLALLRATRSVGVRKAIIFTFYAGMSPIGLIAGALGASILAKLTWWSWVYWAHSITLIILGTISCFTIPSAPQTHSPVFGWRTVILELDLPGMITGSTALGLFGFSWSQAHAVGWQQAYIGIILIMSLLLAALFVMIETCYAPKPLIPYSAMSWEVFWILVAIGCGWSCFGIWVFYGWQFVERIQSTSPIVTTAYFAPMAAVGCCVAAATRFALHRVGLYAMFCAAMMSITVGGVVTSTIRTRQTYWEQLFISVLFMAWGLYTSVPVATLIILRMVNKKHGGIAATLVCMTTYYSIGLGLGVAGTVERSVLGGRWTMHNRLRSYRAVYWTSIGLAGFGFVVCLALAWVSSGKITDIKVSKADDGTQDATVTFEKETAAKTAQLLNNTELDSSQIAVTAANGQSDDAAPHTASADRDTDHITQEEKPRSRILAEYLAHGYVIGDAAIERAIDLDHKQYAFL